MKKPMRVLHVLKHFRPTFTGEGVFLERVAVAMDMLAPQVEHDILATVTLRPKAPLVVQSTLRNTIYLQERVEPHWRAELRMLLWFLRHVRQYDVVHVRTHCDRYFLVYVIAKLFGKRLVLSATLDDSVPGLMRTYRPALRPLVRQLFRLFDAFVSISPKLQAETVSVVGEAKTAQLIPIGITIPDVDAGRALRTRARLGLDADDLVLIFVGGICDRKDPLFLVQHLPAALAVEPRLKLVLVGPVLEPEHHQRIIAEIKANGLEDKVLLVGEVHDPSPLFEAADIMTFTSHLEGFGTVVIEGMAHGLPVVARHLPGVNDLFVRPGETGFLFTQPEEYDACLARLLKDADLRRAMGGKGRALVIENFSMPTVARRYLELYGAAPAHHVTAQTLAESPAVRDLPVTASLVNRRFWHLAEPPMLQRRPVLVTLVDAEESFDWSQPFSRANTDVRAMAAQSLAHAVFERFGVVPTYMVDYPVASQPDGYGPLLDYLRDGRCDVGAQLHPWVNPPHEEEVNRTNSFLCNLPLPLQYEKMRVLTECIGENLGTRPLSFRAGRYGLGSRTGDFLKALGYRIDTSVIPQRSFSPEDGPIYYGFPVAPYWADTERTLLEIPATSALTGMLARQMPEGLLPMLFGPFGEHVALPAAMSRLGLVERIRLSPEGIPIDAAKRLTRYLLARGVASFTLSYHSPSLAPGNTPYVQSAADLRNFLDWLTEFYEFFFGELGGVSMTCLELRDQLMAADGDARAQPDERRVHAPVS